MIRLMPEYRALAVTCAKRRRAPTTKATQGDRVDTIGHGSRGSDADSNSKGWHAEVSSLTLQVDAGDASMSSAGTAIEDLPEEGKVEKCQKMKQDLASSRAEVSVAQAPALTQESLEDSWTEDRIPQSRPEPEL